MLIISVLGTEATGSRSSMATQQVGGQLGLHETPNQPTNQTTSNKTKHPLKKSKSHPEDESGSSGALAMCQVFLKLQLSFPPHI